MTRNLTTREALKVGYFIVSLCALCIFCEAAPVIAVLNLAVSAALLRTVNVDEIIND